MSDSNSPPNDKPLILFRIRFKVLRTGGLISKEIKAVNLDAALEWAEGVIGNDTAMEVYDAGPIIFH